MLDLNPPVKEEMILPGLKHGQAGIGSQKPGFDTEEDENMSE